MAMTELFHYNTIKTHLSRETKSLHIILNRPEHQNKLNGEMIFELETLLSWCAGHIEIQTIVLSGNGGYFSGGFDFTELEKFDDAKVLRTFQKLTTIIKSQYFLPQTIIADLGDGAAGAGIELALGADIRIMNNSGELDFNFLNDGLTPFSGACGLLSVIVGPANGRNWLLRGDKVSATELKSGHFISDSYEKSESILDNILASIASQSPMARMQTKRALLEVLLPQLDNLSKKDENISRVTFSSHDWRRKARSENNPFVDVKGLREEMENVRNNN
jgi:enoyl-CoA hydratase/carnithine racemase